MKSRYSKGLGLVIALTVFLGACSTGPKIFINADPGADFGSFRTYNYEQNLGTDQQAEYRSVLSQFMMNAVDREMQARGYIKDDNPDLTINFNLSQQEKIRATSSPSVGGYYGYRGYRAYGGYDTTVTQYTEGTLNIDIIDNTRTEKQLVWEGIAVGRMSDKARANLEEAVNTVVADIFARYPHLAPGFVPAETTASN
jgi:hypothetical protein